MKRRFVYDRTTGKCREVTADHVGGPRVDGPMVLKDINQVYGGGFKSPIDGEFITSRSQLRAHERKHGVRQAGDFKPGELIAHEEKRVERMREAATGATFKWM